MKAWPMKKSAAAQRSGGTLMAYRGQQASGDPLLEPGAWDLTAHLCVESVDAAAAAVDAAPHQISIRVVLGSENFIIDNDG